MTTTSKKFRHSETRDKIYTYLCNTKEHPSADTIYQDLRESIPTLSIGTVYNNLNHFVEQGMVVRVANVNGVERYDANCEDHVHFVCDECGAVIDVMEADIQGAKKVCHVGQAQIKSIQIVIHGICKNCSDNLYKGENFTPAPI